MNRSVRRGAIRRCGAASTLRTIGAVAWNEDIEVCADSLYTATGLTLREMYPRSADRAVNG